MKELKPGSDCRWKQFSIVKAEVAEQEKMTIEAIDDLTNKIEIISLKKDDPKYKCTLRDAGYSSEGYLKHHLNEKHQEAKTSYKCDECQKQLSSKRNLDNHVLSIHRTCKQCKPNAIFNTGIELERHTEEHKTCKLCMVNMKSAYKLERHMKTHKL